MATVVVTAAALAGPAAALPPGATASAAPRQQADPFAPDRIHELAFAFDNASWLAELRALPADGYVYADVSADGAPLTGVGVRIKGNSSARGGENKPPLNVTFDASVAGQRLGEFDTLNLNNGFADPTFAREAVTTALLRRVMPAPRAAYARMTANGSYHGLYLGVEQIEGTFLDTWYGSHNGWLFKADRLENRMPGGPRSDLTWLGEDLSAYRGAYELKSDAGDEAYEALRELIRTLSAPPASGGVSDAEFPAAIASVLDVDQALWYIAAMNLYTNFDSYYSGHNYYLFRAERDGLFHMLPWDVNESFGVFPGAGIDPADTAAVAATDPFLMSTGQQAQSRPLIRRLLTVPAFRADYLAHYRALMAEGFAADDLGARVAAAQDLIREDLRTDPNRLYSFDDFSRNVTDDVRLDGGRAVPGLLRLADLRRAHLASEPALAPPDHDLTSRVQEPQAPTAQDDVHVTLAFGGAAEVASVDLVVRVKRGAPTTLALTRAGAAWTAVIPRQGVHDTVAYYARVVLADGRVAFHPSANLVAPWSYEVAGSDIPRGPAEDLVLNEVLADNETVLADEAGEFDDWVEVVNRGTAPQGLAGLFLSDDPADPWLYAFPDVTLAPGEHFLVWCDNDPDQGPTHADFRLNKDGETVALSTDEAIVDQVEYGPQVTDVTWARMPDGSGAWMSCPAPSPRAANACSAAPTHTVFLPFASR